MARIVVSGYMLRHPLAGNISAFFQYVLGLHRLGHEVLYLEDKGWNNSAYDPATGTFGDVPHAGLTLIRRLVAEHCPGVPVVFVDPDCGLVDGMGWHEVKQTIAGCDLLLDVSGMCWLPERERAPRRVLVDLDPMFTQIGQFGHRLLGEYQLHFSYGANVGRDWCAVPTEGFDWIPTAPPVVADLWQAPPPLRDAPMTTVANWSAYGGSIHEGVWYGQKDVEFERLGDLPRRVAAPLEIAVSGASEETQDGLRSAGWRLAHGAEVTRTLSAYRTYIAGSQAEFSVAKHGYVTARTGWFSDRTVCYLAAGRPAILQDTGFTSWLPSGRGVLAFSTLDEAASAIHAVAGDLPSHSRAAAAIARSVFDYRVVLPRLVDRCLRLPKRRNAVA